MHNGLIVTSFGRNFIVEVGSNKYQAVTKSKKTNYVVGDEVEIDIINSEQAQIIKLLPRTNLVFRTDKNRSKIIASNISQILIVIAIKPSFNINFLNSCLVFAESQNITPIIIINKIDLDESKDFIDLITATYAKQLNYMVVCISAAHECSQLESLLADNRTLLIGQSGVGKSTITNKIIPSANTQTNIITKAQTSGKHTTTNATLYHIDQFADLIDCPGLHEFGLYHLKQDEISLLFPECRELFGQCRFRNCKHLNEPNCAITNAYHNGKIHKQRFEFMQDLIKRFETK